MKSLGKIFLCISILFNIAILPQMAIAAHEDSNGDYDQDGELIDDDISVPSEPVFTGGGLQGGLETLEDEAVGTGIETEFSFTEMVLYWIKVLLTILGTIAFVAFIWAGVLYITAFAREENVEQAKKAMIYAAIGIIIILISYVVVEFLINMGVETCNPANGNADCNGGNCVDGYCVSAQ